MGRPITTRIDPAGWVAQRAYNAQDPAQVLKSGGYIPFGDHLIPPEVRWADFRYYREKLNRLIDAVGV